MKIFISISRKSEDLQEENLQRYFTPVPKGAATKSASFYFDHDDDESGFAFSAKIAAENSAVPFEIILADIIDLFGAMFGITNAKFNGQFLF